MRGETAAQTFSRKGGTIGDPEGGGRQKLPRLFFLIWWINEETIATRSKLNPYVRHFFCNASFHFLHASFWGLRRGLKATDIFECCRPSKSKTLLFSFIQSNGLCGSLKTFRLISVKATAIPTSQRNVLRRSTRKRNWPILNFVGFKCPSQVSIWVKAGFNCRVKFYRLLIQWWKH